MFCKKGVLKTFAKFRGNHLLLSFILTVTGLRCDVSFVRFSKTTVLSDICEPLPLKIIFIRIQLYSNWQNHLKQFPHTQPTNIAILFSTENIKRENANFWKMQLLRSGLFSSLGKPGLWISRLYFFLSMNFYELSLYKVNMFT